MRTLKQCLNMYFGCTPQEVRRLPDFQQLVKEIETAEVKGGALDAACEKLMHLVESTATAELYYIGRGLICTLPALCLSLS